MDNNRRQRTPEDIAILYKGQHQYSASRRVQDAINEQVRSVSCVRAFASMVVCGRVDDGGVARASAPVGPSLRRHIIEHPTK